MCSIHSIGIVRIRSSRRQRHATCQALERRRLLSTVLVNTLLDESVANATTSLREAIAMAVAGDTIQFQSGLTGRIDLAGAKELVIDKNLSLAGPGPGGIQVSGVQASRVFRVTAGVTATISGIRILDGEAESGAGIYSEAQSLTLSDVVIANNTAQGKNGLSDPSGEGGAARGGGIYNAGGVLEIKASTIGGNKAIGGNGVMTSTTWGNGGAALGAGIYNANGTLRVSGSTLAGNNAVGGPGYYGTAGGNGGLARGGAIYSSGGVVEIASSSLSGNAATGADGAKGYIGPGGVGGAGEGGAVFSGAGAGGVFISASDINSNLAWGGEGGDAQAILNSGGTASGGGVYAAVKLEVTDSKIRSNTAHAGRTANASGGGVFAGGTVTIIRTTIDGNKASALSQSPEYLSRSGGTANGGGIVAAGGEIKQSTISNNTAEGGAGGVGYFLKTTSHPAGNGGAARGGGIFVTGLLAMTNSTVARNLVRGGNGGDFNPTTNIPAGDGGDAVGGGIFVNFGASLEGWSITVAANQATPGKAGGNNGPATAGADGTASGGGIEQQGITSPLSSIIAGNTALMSPDVHGAFASHGFNLVGKTDGSGGWIASDLKGTVASPLDAKLSELADNGGPTKTMLPLPTSPVIDAGAHTSNVDQRGLSRPFDVSNKPNASGSDGSDIGAVELQSSPYVGIAPTLSAAGATTIQSENFDEGGEGVAYHDQDAANLGGSYRTSAAVDVQSTSDSGGGFNVGWAVAGEWLKYSVDVVDAGTYTVDLRVASNGPGGTFHLEVDGVNASGPLTVPNTYGWQSWTTLSKSGITLSAGRHTLRLVMDANGSTGAVGNFNFLKFTFIATLTGQTPFKGEPFVVGSTPVTIEAEDFDKGGENVAYHDLEAANEGGQYRAAEAVDIQWTTDTGAGYNVGWARAGEWLEYSLDVTSSAFYNFEFRVASTGSGGMFHAEIDGVDVTSQLVVPNTGGWQNWQTVPRGLVSLTAGKHVLRLVMDANGTTGAAGNFNYIKISPAAQVQVVKIASDTAAYVRDGGFANTNYGNEPELLVKESTPGFKRESFIKFDLSSVAQINSATLTLFGRLKDALSFPVEVEVDWTTSNGWSESGITWNNRPTDRLPVGTIAVSGTALKWYAMDLTNFLKSEKAAGRNIVSFVLRSLTFTSTVCAFDADGTTNAPYLTIT